VTKTTKTFIRCKWAIQFITKRHRYVFLNHKWVQKIKVI